MIETVSEPPKYSRQVILQALDFEMADAYWISIGGKIRPVSTTHIEDVVKSPVSFDLTDKYVKDMYKKHREKLGIEGKARDEIIKGLVLTGRTRIRYNRDSNYYSIDVGKLNEKVREYLFQWAFKTVEAYPDRQTTRVVIVEFCTMANTIYLLGDLVGDALLSKKKQQDLVMHYLIPLKREDDFLLTGPSNIMKNKLQSTEITSGDVG
jgi:hypothetical protein